MTPKRRRLEIEDVLEEALAERKGDLEAVQNDLAEQPDFRS
jgi:hypothetical protein